MWLEVSSPFLGVPKHRGSANKNEKFAYSLDELDEFAEQQEENSEEESVHTTSGYEAEGDEAAAAAAAAAAVAADNTETPNTNALVRPESKSTVKPSAAPPPLPSLVPTGELVSCLLLLFCVVLCGRADEISSQLTSYERMFCYLDLLV